MHQDGYSIYKDVGPFYIKGDLFPLWNPSLMGFHPLRTHPAEDFFRCLKETAIVESP